MTFPDAARASQDDHRDGLVLSVHSATLAHSAELSPEAHARRTLAMWFLMTCRKESDGVRRVAREFQSAEVPANQADGGT